jgi:hypothetical protein
MRSGSVVEVDAVKGAASGRDLCERADPREGEKEAVLLEGQSASLRGSKGGKKNRHIFTSAGMMPKR